MGMRETIVLYPAADSRDLGPKHVDIHLFPPVQGSAAHALRATLPVPEASGIVRRTYRHPLNEGGIIAIAPGMIEVESLQGSTLSLFGLGGFAHARVENQVSTLEIESTAPIVLVGKTFFDDDLDPIDLFVGELGAWLSILRASARGRVAEFDRLLLKIPAYTLYVQGLILAAKRLAYVLVDERSDRYWRSHAVIHHALEAAKQHPGYPNPMPNFERLLSVN